MDSVPAISVLLPVCNTEKYLAEALDSLEAQTFRSFEIIAVNDGSTDRSGEILRSYAARFPNIRLIEQPNRGKPAALNAGLEREPFMKTRSGFPLAISGANTATAQRNRMAASPGMAVLLFRNFFHISRTAEYSC